MTGTTFRDIRNVINEHNSNTIITSVGTYMDKDGTGIAFFSSENDVEPVAKIPFRDIKVPDKKNK